MEFNEVLKFLAMFDEDLELEDAEMVPIEEGILLEKRSFLC
jgi:hypothetical protein